MRTLFAAIAVLCLFGVGSVEAHGPHEGPDSIFTGEGGRYVASSERPRVARSQGKARSRHHRKARAVHHRAAHDYRPGLIRSKSGATARVSAAHAGKFQCLVDWLDQHHYRIDYMGGWRKGNIAGTNIVSEHAKGRALDINQRSRNRVTRTFPDGTNAAARNCGLLHGDRHAWPRQPDAGHFQVYDRRADETPVIEQLSNAIVDVATAVTDVAVQTTKKIEITAAPAISQFAEIRKSIAKQWAAMEILPRQESEVDRTAARLVRPENLAEYRSIEEATGVPAILVAVIHYREGNADFRLSLAQGDRWDRKSIHVPKNRGPFASWREAALDAIRIEELDKVGRENWTIELALFYSERFNGNGYRKRNLPSPYVWAKSTLQQPGKFVADGKFNRRKLDDQIGVAPLMAKIIDLDPGLAIPTDVARLPASHPAARGYQMLASATP